MEPLQDLLVAYALVVSGPQRLTDSTGATSHRQAVTHTQHILRLCRNGRHSMVLPKLPFIWRRRAWHWVAVQWLLGNIVESHMSVP